MTEPAVRRSLRTKIVCTLGPATSAPDRIRALILEGVDCFRINLSHGTEEEHAETIARVRAASREAGRPVPVLLDLRGAKIRTTESRPSPFELRTGAAVALAGGEKPSTEQRLHITPAIALENLEVGHRILIDDGKIELVVTHRRPAEWGCRVVTGGSVNDRRGVTLLEVPTPQLPGLTDKDVSDIAFGVRHGADLFALSFVRSAADVVAARKQIARCGAETPIIAKIEKPEAITELDRILEESYGVMVARGDLGVEAPLEKVPVYQKRIIARARKRCKPVITATQMLESMTDRPVPTRAEVSDVANAVFDGTDAVMLSAETSIGKYPLEAVRMMARAA
ncbi:MAG: pyruvate kinase, partial [Planctomycetes bacterium]|nr:pyruvate kinase [Planctomycetota bacterium]